MYLLPSIEECLTVYIHCQCRLWDTADLGSLISKSVVPDVHFKWKKECLLDEYEVLCQTLQVSEQIPL